MNDKDALFQSVLAAPEDDAPRLIFADWLDENGEPERAEFIRVQIDLARLPARGKVRTALKARETELLRDFRVKILPWIPPPLRGEHSYFECRRGFLEHIETSTPLFVRHAHELSRVTPLRSVKLRAGESRGDALAKLPVMKQLDELDLDGAAFGDSLTQFFTSANFPALSRLNLSSNLLGQDALRVFLACGKLSRLTWLNLGENVGLTDDICRLISMRRELHNLETLLLEKHHSGPGITGAGISILAQSPHLAALKELDLTRHPISTVGGNALSEAAFLPSLEKLKLTATRIMNEAAIRIVRGGRGKLRLLNLSNCVLDDRFLLQLVTLPEAASLRRLNLSINNIRDAGALALAGCESLRKLTALSLGKNLLTANSRIPLLNTFGGKVKF
jgi:uncharacterized protein (TIGR02996 family)